MRTTLGPRRVDVIYRRIDDDSLDPLAFRPGQHAGVPGLLSVYRNGGVTLANAIGTGVADDKSSYPFVPDLIKFYLGEDPILQNVPPTVARDRTNRAYVLDHLAELVVKQTQGSGGYGDAYRPRSTKDEQPSSTGSSRPTRTDTSPNRPWRCRLARHSSRKASRPGTSIFARSSSPDPTGSVVVPGGLTRVALSRGSLVVNSSQGRWNQGHLGVAS